MEGEGDCSLATATAATDPTAEQGLEVESRWRKPSVTMVEVRGTTTRGQRPQRCGAAAGGGTSSRGVKAQPGKPPSDQTFLHAGCFWQALSSDRGAEEEWSTDAETLRTPSGTGMQQAWNPFVEKTVGVVQNHEGGTSRPERHPVDRRRRQRHQEWTRAEISEEGLPSRESHERQVHTEQATVRRALRIGSGALEVSQGQEGPSPIIYKKFEREARVRYTLRTNPVTGQGREGSSEGQRAAAERDGRHRPGNGHGPVDP